MEYEGIQYRLPTVAEGLYLKGKMGIGLFEINEDENAYYLYLSKIIPSLDKFIESKDFDLEDRKNAVKIEAIGSQILNSVLGVSDEGKQD